MDAAEMDAALGGASCNPVPLETAAGRTRLDQCRDLLCGQCSDSREAASVCRTCCRVLCEPCAAQHEKDPRTALHHIRTLTALSADTLSSGCGQHRTAMTRLVCPRHAISLCLYCAVATKPVSPTKDSGQTPTQQLDDLFLEEEKSLERGIQRLEEKLTEINQEAEDVTAAVTAPFDRLDSLCEAQRARLRRTARRSAREKLRAVTEGQDNLRSMRRQLAAHWAAIDRVAALMPPALSNMKNTIAVVKTFIDDLDSMAWTENLAADWRVAGAVDRDEAFRIERAIDRMGLVTIRHRTPTHTDKGFRFHENHGGNVRLSDCRRTVLKMADYYIGGGIVVADERMDVDFLYEVQILDVEEESDRHVLPVGVVSLTPPELTIPEGSLRWTQAVVVHGDFVNDHGKKAPSLVGRPLVGRCTGARVGVCLDATRRVHLYVDGEDQGVVPCHPVEDPCFAMFDVCGGNVKITSLPVTSVA